MLPELCQRIDQNVPIAIHSPIPDYNAYYYLSRLTEGLTDVPDFKQVEQEYQGANVSFAYMELKDLSANDFICVQQQLQIAVLSAFSQINQAVPDRISQFLVPGSITNILIHEKKHISVLPEDVKNEARIDVVIQLDSDGQFTIDGISVWDKNKTTDQEEALAFSEPSSLNETDIERARYHAKMTHDVEFIQTIDQRIKMRNRH